MAGKAVAEYEKNTKGHDKPSWPSMHPREAIPMTEITDLSSPVLWLIVGLLWGSMLAVIISEHCSRTRDATERELER